MTTTNPATAAAYAEIVSDAKRRMDEVSSIINGIIAEIEKIKSVSFKRPLNQTERDKIAELQLARIAAVDARDEISYVTLAALDTTDELTRMINSLKTATKDLKDKEAIILAIGSVATKFAAYLTGVAALTKKVKSVLDSRA